MPNFVLLDEGGRVARKLNLVSLPPDFQIPSGMMVSWRTSMQLSSNDSLTAMAGPKDPVHAYFYLGDAWGEIIRIGYQEYKDVPGHPRVLYGVRSVNVTVQGRSAVDVNLLRDMILTTIRSGKSWDVSNDYNQGRGGFLRRLIGK